MPWHSQDEPSERQRSIAQLRAEFQAMPPARQQEKLEQIRHLLKAEQARRQGQPSYLMQIAKDVYGELL